MCGSSKGLFKRILPFFATFAIGLFIASFFMPVGAPGFQGFRGRGWERHKMFERVQAENEQLKLENQQLREALSSGIGSAHDPNPSAPRYDLRHIKRDEFEAPDVTMPVPLAPPPPPARLAPARR